MQKNPRSKRFRMDSDHKYWKPDGDASAWLIDQSNARKRYGTFKNAIILVIH